MPGPKMGPRPPDFDEQVIRQSPTFVKWNELKPGQKLRYACREFTKGHGNDEERLMRRIMIARRNNLKDHETLKRARQQQLRDEGESEGSEDAAVATQTTSTVVESPTTTMQPSSPSNSRKRRAPCLFSDAQVAKEMDVAAVEATRSYRSWMSLPDGEEFVYNQKYTKGKEGHDWLLRKNIWRRMRYRRENKKMVERLKQHPTSVQGVASIVDHALIHTQTQVETAAVEAAVAVAESYAKNSMVVHDPTTAASEAATTTDDSAEDVATTAALDAAARLAAAAAASSTAMAAASTKLEEV